MDEAESLIAGLFIGALLTTIVFVSLGELSGIQISKETANDVCAKITGNESSIAIQDGEHLWNRVLICELPSYDSTQNIFIKQNNED